MRFKEKLIQMGVCDGAAIKWVRHRGLMTAWRDCERADWMLWLAHQLKIDHNILELAVRDCVEDTLQHVKTNYAIRTAKKWLKNKQSIASYSIVVAACDCQRKSHATFVRKHIPYDMVRDAMRSENY